MLVAPTYCHNQTLLSSALSHLLGVTGFPGQRRFTLKSLCEALEASGLVVQRTELMPGLLPIGYVEATAA